MSSDGLHPTVQIFPSASIEYKRKIEITTTKENMDKNRVDPSSSLFEAHCIDYILFVICREMTFNLFLIVRTPTIHVRKGKYESEKKIIRRS